MTSLLHIRRPAPSTTAHAGPNEAGSGGFFMPAAAPDLPKIPFDRRSRGVAIENANMRAAGETGGPQGHKITTPPVRVAARRKTSPERPKAQTSGAP